VDATGILIACILLFIAFAILGVGLSNRNIGVGIKNEKLVSSGPQLTTRYKSLAVGFIAGIIAGYLVTGQPFITLCIGILSAYFMSNWLVNSKQKKQREILEEQYIQVLTSIVSSLQGGANPYQALEETAMSIKNPAKDIFLDILRKNRTGTNYHEALGIAAKEYDWPTLKQLEIAFRLYDRTGSNLIQACNHLLQAAYDRRGDRKQVSAMTMVIRATMVVLSVIPFVLIIFMRLVAPEFIAPLFHTTGGVIVSTIIVGLIVIGNKVGAKMAENILN
jgi:tight adherence protein B